MRNRLGSQLDLVQNRFAEIADLADIIFTGEGLPESAQIVVASTAEITIDTHCKAADDNLFAEKINRLLSSADDLYNVLKPVSDLHMVPPSPPPPAPTPPPTDGSAVVVCTAQKTRDPWDEDNCYQIPVCGSDGHTNTMTHTKCTMCNETECRNAPVNWGCIWYAMSSHCSFNQQQFNLVQQLGM